MDNDNDFIWGTGQPSLKLLFIHKYTSCLSYNSLEAEIDNALNSLSSICPGPGNCIAVTRDEDSAQAPNRHVYTLYFDSSSVARSDIDNPGIDGLQADTLPHADCTTFDSSGGEKIFIKSVSQDKKAPEFSATQVPFGGNLKGRWIGEDSESC